MKNVQSRRAAPALALALSLMLAACGGTTSPGDDDNGSTGGDTGGGNAVKGNPDVTNNVVNGLSLTASTDPVAAGEMITVTATATDETPAASGRPVGDRVSGATVSFNAQHGQLSSDAATTNGNGVATVTFTAPDTPGATTIAAISQGVPSNLNVDIVAGPPDAIQLSASPSTLGFNRSSTLSLQVEDSRNNPVSDLPVRLFATIGDDKDDSDNDAAGTFEDITLITDENGRATTSYTTGSSAGTVMVKAKAGAASSNAISVTVDPDAVRLDTLALKTGNSEIAADGDKSIFVRATLTDTDEKPVQGARVAFASTAGSLSENSAVTDRQGTAQVQLVAPTRAALARVEASVGGLNQASDVEFVPGPISPDNSSITANPSKLLADGSKTATVTVTLSDINGNPVPDATNVRIQSDVGSIQSANPATTSLGRATFTLQAPNNPTDGTIRVVSQPSVKTNVSFGKVPTGTPTNILIDTNPQAISVSGVGQNERATIDITVVDSRGNPIDESKYDNDGSNLKNVRVALLTRPNGGEFLAGTNADGDSTDSIDKGFVDVRTSNGKARVNVQSGKRPGIVEARVQVLEFDGEFRSPSDDGKPVATDPENIATTASIPQLSIASGPPNTLVFTAPQSESIINEGRGVYSRVGTLLVTDKYGNAVPDGTAISLGLLDSVIAKGEGSIKVEGPNAKNPDLLRSNSFDFDTSCTTPLDCNDAQFNFTSTIVRNGSMQGIEDGYRILIPNAKAEDKGRFVKESSLGNADMLRASQKYIDDLSAANFVIGASLLGGEIAGIDEDGNPQTGTGVTVRGRLPFRVTYPANRDTIGVGCYGSALDGLYSRDDKRFNVPQSAQVYLVASASKNNATGTSRNQFCFAPIAEFELDAAPTSISGTQTINLELKDGGDGVHLPFIPITATSTVTSRGENSGFDIDSVRINDNPENQKQQTDINGNASAVIATNCGAVTCEPGDSAVVTFRAGDAAVEVTVTIP